jgi:hypothetical protein
MTFDPTPLIDRTGLTHAALARLLGIEERTLRRYVQRRPARGARDMPLPCQRLLAAIVDVPGVKEYLEKIASDAEKSRR